MGLMNLPGPFHLLRTGPCNPRRRQRIPSPSVLTKQLYDDGSAFWATKLTDEGMTVCVLERIIL